MESRHLIHMEPKRAFPRALSATEPVADEIFQQVRSIARTT
jgi:hypothetical protein